MRLNRTGVIAGLLYVSVGLSWLGLARESLWWPAAAWLIAVAVMGAFIPGAANQVTLARAYLAAPVFVYAVHQSFGPIAVAVALAGVTDLTDGTIARRFGQPSNLGGALDPVVDGLFLGGLVIGLAVGTAFPLWLALVVIARYLLPALAGGLLLAAGRRPELRHTVTGQVSTTLILVLVGGVCLFRALHQDSSGLLNAAEVVIPVSTVATYTHLAFAVRRRRPATTAGAG